MFWKESKVYDDTEIKRKISDLELEIEKMKSNYLSLRGFINRKIGGKVEIEEEKPEDPFKNMLIPVK